MSFERYEVMTVQEALQKHTPDLSQPGPAQELSVLLNSLHAPATTAVVENDYIDVDYSASYYDQRVRSFSPTNRGTTRIHFFANDLTKRRFVNASQPTVTAMKSNYVGFTVVRPDRPTTLGRTLISCPSNVSGKPARFPTRTTTPVNLAGIPLTVESCHYMSQDTKIMACATAALWMSATPLAEKISGMAAHTTAEITGMAMSLNRPFGPAVGKRGLTLFEMEQALLKIGFDPTIYFRPSPQELVEICHLFSDSGIPPVLRIESNGIGHAVTVIGYTLQSPSSPQTSIPGAFPAHQFVSDLIIHDDQRGMYLLAEAHPTTGRDGNPTTELRIHTGAGTAFATCDAILVPLPRRVMLDVLEVQTQAEEWIVQAKSLGVLEDRDVVYRTILVRSNVFKQTLLEHRDRRTPTSGYPAYLVEFARGLPMPRYIWLVEVSYMANWDPSNPSSPPVVADLIFDSTMTAIMRPDFLMLHFPHLTVGRQVREDRIHPLVETNDGFHPHPSFPDIPRP